MTIQKDWLGNELTIGDLVLYSSTSVHTGMNLGWLVAADEKRIQVKIPVLKWNDKERKMEPGIQIVTLRYTTGAYRSVTRYFGPEIDPMTLV